MTTKLSIRDFTRSSKILLDYDYIDIEDKKSHQYKGVFIPEKYAEEVKAFIDVKIQKEKMEKKKALFSFSGMAENEFGDKTLQELVSEKKDKYK